MSDLHPAQGVLGPIPLEGLGVTSMHEHLVVRMPQCLPPARGDDADLPDAAIDLGTVGRIRRDPLCNHGNLLIDDVDGAIEEVAAFADAGGHTVVDVTNGDFGRDPHALVRAARATGLQFVMGAGHYIAAAHPPDMDDRTVEDLAAEIVADVTVGVGDTGVRAGIIGEVGCSGAITPNERKALRAAALAQFETGAPVSVHQPIPFESRALEVLDVLEDAGADLTHVLICHMDHTLADRGYHKAVADRGCMLEFDRFGSEWYYDSRQQWWEWQDEDRAEAIHWLVASGHGDQVVVGQDICYRINWLRHGGPGFGHLLQRVVPLLERVGIDDAAVRRILVDNPRRFLAFRRPLAAAAR